MSVPRTLAALVALLCLFASPWTAYAQNQPPPADLSLATLRFQPLSLEQGLSQSVVLDVAQDHRGFLWFATEDGLNRYNGYEVTVFRHLPGDRTSLANSYVRALWVDRAGTLWVGTDSGLDRFVPETEAFVRAVDASGDGQSLEGMRSTLSRRIPMACCG